MEPRTVVVGGGLAGLMAAATAARAGTGQVLLFDPHPLGGRARCDVRDGYTFGRGPRALYVGSPAEHALQDLGVVTTDGGPPVFARAGAVAHDGMHDLPQGPASALRTSLMTPLEKFAFAKAFVRLPRIDPASLVGRTVSQWLDGEGWRGVTRQMVESLLRVATYCNAPDHFDAGAALAAIQAALGNGVRYLDGGWQTLVDRTWAVAEEAGVERVTEAVKRVAADPDRPGELRVQTATGEMTATAVCIAAGLPDAVVGLLGGRPRTWPELGPPVTVACLELGLRRPPARRLVLGVDEPLYLSTHAPPAQLAPPGHAVVHAMWYQRPDEEASAAEQRSRLDRLATQAGIDPADIVTHRYLPKMVATGALALASAGGLAGRVPVAVDEHPGVFLAGDWVGPEGILLDAVAASATEAGRRAAAAQRAPATV